MSEDIPPLCVVCQQEVAGGDPVPWHGANAHALCADRMDDADEAEYGEAFGRAFQWRHEAGTCRSSNCVCRRRLRK